MPQGRIPIFVVMCTLSQIFSQLKVTGSSANVQDGARLNIVANGSGVVGLNKLTLMYEYSIPMSPQTDTHAVTENTRWRRSVNMNRE